LVVAWAYEVPTIINVGHLSARTVSPQGAPRRCPPIPTKYDATRGTLAEAKDRDLEAGEKVLTPAKPKRDGIRDLRAAAQRRRAQEEKAVRGE
jgi:hypothetical protein